MYKIKTTSLLKETMQNYFSELGGGESKIVWCSSAGPSELLRAFNFKVYSRRAARGNKNSRRLYPGGDKTRLFKRYLFLFNG
jgi:hypothetical protein